MDQQTIIEAILREARRDCFNGRGRIFMRDFLRAHQITEQQFLKAIQEMGGNRSLLNDNIFFIHFIETNPTSE